MSHTGLQQMVRNTMRRGLMPVAKARTLLQSILDCGILRRVVNG